MKLHAALACATLVVAVAAAPAVGQRTRVLDPANRDTTCAPCRDFYQWANGGWLARTPIPPAQSNWGSFDELRDRNQLVLHALLEEAARGTRGERPGSARWKLGTFYASCMDSTRADRDGAAPLAAELRRIDAVTTPAALQAEVAALHSAGVAALFYFGAAPELRNSARMGAVVGQGGIALPDRELYLRPDSATERIRGQYLTHIERMMALLGRPDPAAEARHILAMETALARASMTRAQMRDLANVGERVPLAGLQATTPRWSWTAYLRARGAPLPDSVHVRQPAFLRTVDSLATHAGMDAWRAYLRWQLLRASAPVLSRAFADEVFRMQRSLTGTREALPRWRRCLAASDMHLGDALGAAYVERTFNPQARARVQRMVRNMAAVLRERLAGLEWMGDSTRAEALAKLDALGQKIGYPDRWRDYAGLDVRPGPFLENLRRAQRYGAERSLARIGRPVGRAEWAMTAPAVNAYYHASLNEIVFPAGILQPPFFDPEADDAVNYGAIGAVIGHEITHAFDDQGRKFDASGNMRDWWAPADAAAYRELSRRVVEQFSAYTVVDSVRVNGQLSLGENIADLGGLTIAYHALQRELGSRPRTRVDGFTPEQRFFMAWAQIWRRNTRPETLRLQASVDAHPPSRWRTNGPLGNMPEFAAAFGCTAGDPMVRPDSVRVQIW
jgi:predicted metalloendopeptidase